MLLIKINKTFDLLVMFASCTIASFIIFMSKNPNNSISQFFSSSIQVQNLIIILFLFISCTLIFQVVGIYRSRRIGSRYGEFVDILKAVQKRNQKLVGKDLGHLVQEHFGDLPDEVRNRLAIDLRGILQNYAHEVFGDIKQAAVRRAEHYKFKDIDDTDL